MGNFTAEAKQYWDTVPESIKVHIIYNVFCEKCKVTSIVNYTGKIDGYLLVLTGFCKKCGNKVTRTISII